MALNKDILGQDLYNARAFFTNKTMQDLINDYGDLEAARLAICKAEADVIINHFKTYGNVIGNVATTGSASAQSGVIVAGTGKIQ